MKKKILFAVALLIFSMNSIFSMQREEKAGLYLFNSALNNYKLNPNQENEDTLYIQYNKLGGDLKTDASQALAQLNLNTPEYKNVLQAVSKYDADKTPANFRNILNNLDTLEAPKEFEEAFNAIQGVLVGYGETSREFRQANDLLTEYYQKKIREVKDKMELIENKTNASLDGLSKASHGIEVGKKELEKNIKKNGQLKEKNQELKRNLDMLSRSASSASENQEAKNKQLREEKEKLLKEIEELKKSKNK